MSAWGVVDTVNIVSIFLLSLFSLFLFTQKREKPVSNRALGFFLLAWALALLNHVVSRPGRISPSLLPVFLFLNAVAFLLGPLLFFYVKTVAYRDFSWRKAHIWHGLPLAIYLAALGVAAALAPETFRTLDALRGSFFGSSGMRFFTLVISCQLLSYIAASLFVLRSYRVRIKDSYSSLEKISLTWLYVFIGGFGLIWLIGSVNYVTAVIVARRPPTLELSILNIIITLTVAAVILFRALKQPAIFFGVEEKPKYEYSALSSAEADRILSALNSFMAAEKPYLVPGLSIGELAKNVGYTPRAVSQVINSRLGKNFLDFVNSYRVEEAKRLLSASGSNGKTILEVAFESGFNSKSVFNKAFKKHAGVTPKDFKYRTRSAA